MVSKYKLISVEIDYLNVLLSDNLFIKIYLSQS